MLIDDNKIKALKEHVDDPILTQNAGCFTPEVENTTPAFPKL